MVEHPFFFRVGKYLFEQLNRLVALEEYVLAGRLVVGESGGYHHAFYAQRHGFVEESAHFVGVGVVENRRVGSDPEAAFYGFLYPLDGDVVGALLIYGLVVHFARAVEVYA